MLMFPCCVGLV